MGIAERQQQMAAAVDEHDAASKAVADAHVRLAELEREAHRLEQALIQTEGIENNEDSKSSKNHNAALNNGEAEEAEALEAAAKQELEVAPEKLALHCAYLLRLAEENQRLKKQCATLTAS